MAETLTPAELEALAADVAGDPLRFVSTYAGQTLEEIRAHATELRDAARAVELAALRDRLAALEAGDDAPPLVLGLHRRVEAAEAQVATIRAGAEQAITTARNAAAAAAADFTARLEGLEAENRRLQGVLDAIHLATAPRP